MISRAQVSFVVPCFNEECNVIPTIETIIRAVTDLNLTYEIIVIDDGSVDGTSATVKKYIAEYPGNRIILIRNERNKGLGFNYVKGVSIARGEYYMAVFGDHSEPLEALKIILEKIGQAEIVVPYPDQSTRSLFRRFISKAFTLLCNFLSGQKIRYYNGPVLHKRLNVLQFSKNISFGFGYQAELLCQLLIRGSSFVEVFFPINFRTSGGTSAFRISNMISVAGSLLKILKFRFTKK